MHLHCSILRAPAGKPALATDLGCQLPGPSRSESESGPIQLAVSQRNAGTDEFGYWILDPGEQPAYCLRSRAGNDRLKKRCCRSQQERQVDFSSTFPYLRRRLAKQPSSSETRARMNLC